MEELVAKKNTYSPVWAFFGLKKDHEDDDESVICRLCRAVTLVRGGNKQFVQPPESPPRERACFDRKEQEKEQTASKQRQSR